jgi:hypothetical protein
LVIGTRFNNLFFTLEGGGMAQVIQCLSRKHETLSSNPSAAKKKKKKEKEKVKGIF